jgi:2,4-dienoyl-CoA reductase-like NADH-dependent reductase (Old Yellow Enzyme family)
VLAPLTNQQSHSDGVLSDDEFHWLTMRALGGFSVTMTCAASVQGTGVGFSGQLGLHDDRHLPGLTRFANAIKDAGSLAVAQLHHAGMRSPRDLIGQVPLCPSDNEETGARALTLSEVHSTIEDFVHAAKRCKQAGFDGVEIHGAHGYLICQFLSPEINLRTDQYGGASEARSRFLMEIIDGIHAECGAQFGLGVRLSPERFGLRLEEIRSLAQRLMHDGRIDYLDISLWDVFKEPAEAAFQGRSLLSWFTDLDRCGTRLGAAGKLINGEACHRALGAGLDFVVIGRGAILHHDFPKKVQRMPDFSPVPLPVTIDHLRQEGLGAAFIDYMRRWDGFVDDN